MYGNYGRQQDLDILQHNRVLVNGSVLLLRTGKISFAEQVGSRGNGNAAVCLVSCASSLSVA